METEPPPSAELACFIGADIMLLEEPDLAASVGAIRIDYFANAAAELAGMPPRRLWLSADADDCRTLAAGLQKLAALLDKAARMRTN